MTTITEPSTIWEGLSESEQDDAAYLVRTFAFSPRPRQMWREKCVKWGVDAAVMRAYVAGLRTSDEER